MNLIELLIVLMLSSIMLCIALPTAARGRDSLAVAAARSELTAAVAGARSSAILAGGAVLVLETVPARVRVQTLDGRAIGDVRELGALHGVTVQCDRGSVVELRFDALGVGRLANSVIRIRRGAVQATLTLSAYGRVRQ